MKDGVSRLRKSRIMVPAALFVPPASATGPSCLWPLLATIFDNNWTTFLNSCTVVSIGGSGGISLFPGSSGIEEVGDVCDRDSS